MRHWRADVTSSSGGEAEGAFDLGRHRPRPIAFDKRRFFQRGTAQSAPRRQEGNRFEQIRLAGAVRAGEDDEVAVDGEARGAIAAKVRQRQAEKADRRWFRH
jgi:hypothetical protein